MNWTYLDEAVRDHGLAICPLTALRPDRNTYRIMLHQHKGRIEATTNGVRNEDRPLAQAKFRHLFAVAQEQRAEILATPEYSCPWSIIEELCEGVCWPPEGTVWVIGCESLTPDELNAIQARHGNAQWIVAAFQADAAKSFLDPVCILFNARDDQGNSRRVIAVQFKSYPMADREHMIEPDHMIHGSQGFILRNNIDSISLATLVCSDVLKPATEREPTAFESIPQHRLVPYILLHLQLCVAPRHIDFTAYRRDWCSFDMQAMQVFCLNWARHSEIFGESFKYGGSAFYDKVLNGELEEPRFNECHAGGLYYVRDTEGRAHCYLYNYDEHIIHLECDKTSQTAERAVVRRASSGPRGTSYWAWRNDALRWHTSEPSDDFLQCCRSVHQDLAPITAPATLPAMRERLACLSSGTILRDTKKKWHDLKHLPSIQMDRTEVSHRVTFVHDPNEASLDERLRRLLALRCIKHEVLRGDVALPSGFAKLRATGEVLYPATHDSLDHNVALPTGEYAATFIYIGDSSPDLAKVTASELTKALSEVGAKLVVWYRDNGDLRYIIPELDEQFGRDPAETCASITRV